MARGWNVSHEAAKRHENAKIWSKLPKKEGAREWFFREIRCEKGVNWFELGGE